MTDLSMSAPARSRRRSWVQFQTWQLALLVAYLAVAIVNVQDQRRHEGTLIALASAGFAAYWVLGWVGWRIARRLGANLNRLTLLAVYLTAMSVLFFAATVIYLVAEYAYLVRHP